MQVYNVSGSCPTPTLSSNSWAPPTQITSNFMSHIFFVTYWDHFWKYYCVCVFVQDLCLWVQRVTRKWLCGLDFIIFHHTGPRDWNEIIKILSHLPGFIASLKLKLFFYNILNFVMLLIWFFCHCQFNDFIVQFLSKWKA